MNGKKAAVHKGIVLRISALVFAVWIMCMAAITLAASLDVMSHFSSIAQDLPKNSGTRSGLDRLYSPEGREERNIPGVKEYSMILALDGLESFIFPKSYGNYDPDLERLDIYSGGGEAIRSAGLFIGRDGKILAQSGSRIYFRYVTKAVWQTHGEEKEVSGYAWIDLELDEYEKEKYRRLIAMLESDSILALRITGYIGDNGQINPLSISGLQPTDDYEEALEGLNAETTVSHTRSEMDELGLAKWQVYMDEGFDIQGKLPVTVYALDMQICFYEAGQEVNYREEDHENLLSLLNTMAYYGKSGQWDVYSGASDFGIINSIVFVSRGYGDGDDGAWFVSAFELSPLFTAVSFLKRTYFLTFTAAAAGCFLVCSSIKRNLTKPLQKITSAMDDSWSYVPELNEKKYRWRELAVLSKRYIEERERRMHDMREIQRLNTALEYAYKAEKERRRITSNIAHELKTPLTVIHGYAEGMKEKIAEEKRERYLDNILGEAEHMDAMVTEMLDLSRLEAGRVKLDYTEFDLFETVKEAFGRFERKMSEKSVSVSFPSDEICIVTADRARIAQAVENIASNAVKYTPCKGEIRVKVFKENGKTVFTTENSFGFLAPEELTKVWEPFYRSGSIYSEEGTGLGLAIVKGIIELHGGECISKTTELGVIFGFRI